VSQPENSNSHIAALDGLRGLAAIVVIVSHFTNGSGLFGGALGHGAGQVGVMLFFCLSGFLMSHLYLDRPFDLDHVTEFARRRFARVVPLYILAVLVSYALAMPNVFHVVNAANLWSHLLFLKGESYLWTVPVEIQFYVVFPLIWLGFRKVGNSSIVWLAIVAAAIVWAGSPKAVPMLPYFAFFATGVAIGRVKLSQNLDLAFCVAIALFVVSLPKLRLMLGLPPISEGWTSPLYLLTVGALVLTSAHSRIAELVLGSSVGSYLGAISYSMYLGHVPILYLSMILPAPTPVKLLVFLCGTLALATFTYYTIERPARRWIAMREPHTELRAQRPVEA
jgi:peptidoglycan/LPS O-acetylase OafA/YrhL